MKYKRTTILILAALSCCKCLFFGKSNKTPVVPPKKIIGLVLTTNVGDMIFATSVFRAIKEKYPTTHLTIVGSKKNTITLFGNKDIDIYIATPTSVWELVKILKAVNADFGFSLATGSVEIASMVLSGLKSIATFDVKNAKAHTRSYSLLKSLCIQVPFYIGQYFSQEYLRILEPINIFSTNTKKYLYYDENVAKNLKVKFLEKGIDLENERIVAISPGAGTKIKQWPEDRFATVARYLENQEGYRIAVIGGPGDKKEIELFSSYFKSDTLIDASALSLEELKYFISTCKLLIANDSGPVYIAEAFKVPTFVLVGPTDEIEHPPRGTFNIVVTPQRDVAPVMRGHIVGYNKEEARRQIEEITVDVVLTALKGLIVGLKQANI